MAKHVEDKHMYMGRRIARLAVRLLALALFISTLGAGGASAQVCPRFPVGSIVTEPPDLFSHNGVLNVALTYETAVDQAGRILYCFITPDGKQSPTLHVHPGDLLVVTLTNNVPAAAAMPGMSVAAADVCGAATMTGSSVNIHYHGTNVSPACHSDEVIHTLINSGDTFEYNIQFPNDEPPGLYWYHPHVHGIAEAAVQGGASGAIVVDGIENVQPAVAGLPERVLVIRDNPVAGNPPPGHGVPSWDISLNYAPIPYTGSRHYIPPVIPMVPDEKQFWRVVNASADTIVDLQLQYDGHPQTLSVVGLDGVPTGSQDGTRRGKLVPKTDILVAPAARAEFIVTGPSADVRRATLLTRNVDTGPGGDSDPKRPLATIRTKGVPLVTPRKLPGVNGPATRQRFEGLEDAQPTARRKLYFSEVLSNPQDPASPTDFFITVDGATPTLFSATNPPAIITTQGSVEDWTIENRTFELHEFHFHQIHFLLEESNGVPVAKQDRQFLDMIQIPYWTGAGAYPSVKVRMDFRGADIGDFVYHCHILGHEDNGMMAIIRVLPDPTATSSNGTIKATRSSDSGKAAKAADSSKAAPVRSSPSERMARLR